MQHRFFQGLSLACVFTLCSAAAFAAGQTATVHKPSVEVHGANYILNIVQKKTSPVLA